MQPLRVGILCGSKASDAALCSALLSEFPNSVVVQYQIPVRNWLPWLWRRVRERGLVTLLGHLALSTYLRLARLRDRLLGRSLWRSLRLETPTWKGIATIRVWNEHALINALQDCDIVVMTDAYRVSHRFFRRINAPCLQIVWGDAPLYMGDSGAFWAFALGDERRIGASIILRGTHFNNLSVVSSLPITVTAEDSLRSIKIKQVATLTKHLPAVVNAVATRKPFVLDKRFAASYHYYAPTLWTYLRVISTGPRSTLPHYARREKPCTLIRLSL